MKLITLDFETYYDREYSLKKLTTEEYIRDYRFEVIGVSVKEDTNPAVWCSGDKPTIKKFLDQFPWDDSIAVAHNAMFDMAILNWHFDIKPKRIADTLSMSRAVHDATVGGSLDALVTKYNLGTKGTAVLEALGKGRLDFNKEELQNYADYCCNDTELTYRLFKILAQDFPINEFKLIDLTVRMFTEPTLELDTHGLVSWRREVAARKDRVMLTANVDKEALMSNPKFAELLKVHGVTPPMKISSLTGKETFAFAKGDHEFMALLEHEEMSVQTLVSARLGMKSTIEETRTQRFIDIASRGTLPIPLRYYAAHTGRWGGDDKVNLQNLPRNSTIKKCILAPEGFVLVDSDSSQIEARTLAWLAEQNDLVDAFEKGEDVYTIMASAIHNKPEKDITKNERFVGKTVVLGCGYGLGAERLQKALNDGKQLPTFTTAEDAQQIIHTYRTTYSRIPLLWRQAQDALKAMINNQTAPLGRDGVLSVEGVNGIRLPNGLLLKYPNLREVEEDGKRQFVYDTKRGRTIIPNKIYGGKLIENVCQALARIIIGEQMLKINRKFKVVLTVHDSIVSLVPKHEEGTGKEFVELCMRIRPEWAPGLPLNCEAHTGVTYGK